MKAVRLLLVAASLCTASEDRPSTQVGESCGWKLGVRCLKEELVRGMAALGSRKASVALLPGLVLSSTPAAGPAPATAGTDPDTLLWEAGTRLLKGLTLTATLYNEEALDLLNPHTQNLTTGRGKKMKLFSLYTFMAVAFALMSTMVGKAMALSAASLVVSMLGRGGGGGGAGQTKAVAYDVVRRPQLHFANTHTYEDVFEGARNSPQLRLS